MDTEQERSFADFLIKEKAVLKEEDFQICLEVQAALRKFDLEKRIEKIIVEKGFLSEKCIATLLQEFKGGDDNFIPGYLVTKKLGEGAMGEVYQGIDLNNNNRPVAIKVLFPHLGKKKSTAKRFLQEGTLCIEKLNHANIVKGYEIGYEANYDFFFYVMELMDGANVRELIDQKGPLSELVAIKILIQITSALDHAYSFKLVHRDIKPDNIMFTSKGVAKLCDLGLARDWSQDLSLTRTGAVMGTPFYISPEGAIGQFMDTRSDIYSLGATMYHIVTGRVPFQGSNAADVLNQHRNTPVIPPIEWCPTLSVGFSAIIEKMMAKNPEERYQTPMELMDDVERLQNGYAPHALLQFKESYGIVETKRPKSIHPSSTISDETEAIPVVEASEITEDDDDKFGLIRITNISEFQDSSTDKVEEYKIEDDSPNFDSIVYVDPQRRRQQRMLSPFLTTTEQHLLARSPKTQRKLILLGGGFVGIIIIIIIILGFILSHILFKNM